jgi:hypothetical protein
LEKATSLPRINATTVILFLIGPGTIFPIVLVVGGFLGALAITPGWVLWAATTGVRFAGESGSKRRLD